MVFSNSRSLGSATVVISDARWPGRGEGVDRHLAEMIDAHDAVGHHAVAGCRRSAPAESWCCPATTTSTRRDSECRKAGRARSSAGAPPRGCSCRPSCNVVTGVPLMALVAELATSILVMPARLARSGSMFSVTWKLSFCHSLRTRRPRRRSAQCLPPCEAMRRISAMSWALCAVLTSAWLTTRISTG